MSVSDTIEGRPTVRIETPQGESVELEYEYPMIDTSSDSRTVEHEPIGGETVVQHLGANAQTLTFRGGAYLDEANFLDGLPEQGVVSIRSHRWSGDAVVDSVSTSATGEGGGERAGVANRVYEYTLDLIEIDGQAPSGGG